MRDIWVKKLRDTGYLREKLMVYGIIRPDKTGSKVKKILHLDI